LVEAIEQGWRYRSARPHDVVEQDNVCRVSECLKGEPKAIDIGPEPGNVGHCFRCDVASEGFRRVRLTLRLGLRDGSSVGSLVNACELSAIEVNEPPLLVNCHRASDRLFRRGGFGVSDLSPRDTAAATRPRRLGSLAKQTPARALCRQGQELPGLRRE
jgi:hypothetical protein